VSEAAHVPVLVEEAILALAVRPEGTYVDGTFGRGGHSAALLARLGVRGRLFAFDQDPEALAACAIQDRRLELIHGRFSEMQDALSRRGVTEVDGVLLDLGVSSPQLDDASRGFSFMRDGPLDMRMDPTRGESAAQFLQRAEEKEIKEVISTHGEERFAGQVARAIVAARRERPILRTGELAALVGGAVRSREPGQHPATRTFQALRIHVNQELEELAVTLPRAMGLLKPGGRLAVISFHSLEDRIVKHFMRDQSTGDKLPRGVPVRASEIAPAPMRLVGKAVKAGEAETRANPRARSATLRVAERTGAA
jgi:16S rRNA (cytosine1402-N4)-methyltransferase